MKRVMMVVMVLAVMVAVVSGLGCMKPGSPETQLSVNPITKTISFTDTKDNDVWIDKAGYNSETKEWSVEKLCIRNNASDVMKQQIEEMKVWNEQMKTANEGIRATLSGLSQLANQFTMILAGARVQAQGEGPLGKGGGEVILGPGAPASQPSNR